MAARRRTGTQDRGLRGCPGPAGPMAQLSIAALSDPWVTYGRCAGRLDGGGRMRRRRKRGGLMEVSQEAVDRSARHAAAGRAALLEELANSGTHPLMVSFPHDALFIFDSSLRCLSAGGRGLATLGLSREAVKNRTVRELFPAAAVESVEPLYRAALGGEFVTGDLTYQGRVHSQRIAPITDAAGEVVAALAFVQDVTEARLAERMHRDAEERARLTFAHAPIGEAIVDLDGRWRHVNAALVDLLGYPEERLLQMTFQDITHPDDLDLDLQHVSELVAGRIGSYKMEKRYFTNTGELVWVLLSVALVRGTDGEPMYFISQIEDITERTRQHQTLTDLTSMLAHDLRTPVTAINAFIELIAADDSLTDDQRHDYWNRIALAAASMTRLLENALAAASSDAGVLHPSPQPIPLRPLIDEVVSMLAGATVTQVDTSDIADTTAWADRTHLTQVLSNLLINAHKYGGPNITLAARPIDGDVEITVADNGPGVPADFIPQLFNRHTRSPTARSTGAQGSGLGLHITRDLVHLNNGTITYQSPLEGGALFAVRLPQPSSGAATPTTVRSPRPGTADNENAGP